MSLQCFYSVAAINVFKCLGWGGGGWMFKFQIRLHKSYVKHFSDLCLNVVPRITGPGKLLFFTFKVKVSVDL